MQAIVNGRLIIDGKTERKAVLMSEGKIVGITDQLPEGIEVIDAQGMYVSAGFIDIHVHGLKKRDMMTDTYNSVMEMSRNLINTGVTAFLATSITQSFDEIRQAIAETKRACFDVDGADVLGIHLEGPFISKGYKGAHNEKYIETPSIENFKKICGEHEDFIKIVTLAPEIEDSHKLIKYLRDKGIIPSIGHTCANYEEAKEGINLGIRSSTHTFNGMKGFEHREPGALGAVLDSDIMAECIADGIHVHPGALRILARQKGLDKIVLVTDSMMAAGMGDGEYSLGGQKVFVKGGIARLKDGTLAGSTLSMNRAVANISSYLGITIGEAVAMATENPSKLLALKDRGRIAEGYIADFIIFDEDINIKLVIKHGSVIKDIEKT